MGCYLYAFELSKQEYNAFAIIFSLAEQIACEYKARAISFIFERTVKISVNTSGYLLRAAW